MFMFNDNIQKTRHPSDEETTLRIYLYDKHMTLGDNVMVEMLRSSLYAIGLKDMNIFNISILLHL